MNGRYSMPSARSLDVLPLVVEGRFNDAMKQLHTD